MNSITSRALFVLSLTILLTLANNAGTVHAQATPAPDLQIDTATCFRNLVVDDDVYCLGRYQLPVQLTASPGSPEAWCAELVDQDGCIADPVLPTAPNTLPAYAAFTELRVASTGVVYGSSLVPRAGIGLTGVYLGAGNSFGSWNTSGKELCVLASDTLYTSPTESCVEIAYSGAANTRTAQRAALGEALIIELESFEITEPLIAPGTLVSQGLITTAGIIYAVEALPFIASIINVFENGSVAVIDGGFTPGPGLDIQADIDATATVIIGQFEALGTDLGAPSDLIGILLFVILGFGGFWFAMRYTGEKVLAIAAFLTVVLSGTLVGAVPVAAVAVMAVLIGILAMMFVLRKQVFA